MKTPEEFYREYYPDVTVLSMMDKEIILLISVYIKRFKENNFVYIVEDTKGHEKGYYSSREKAIERIEDIQYAYLKPLVINCQKIY